MVLPLVLPVAELPLGFVFRDMLEEDRCRRAGVWLWGPASKLLVVGSVVSTLPADVEEVLEATDAVC